MVASRFTTAAAALILSVAALPTPSHAQASREGPTFAASRRLARYAPAAPRHRLRPGQRRLSGRLRSDDARPVPDRRRRAARRQRVLHLERRAAYNQTPRVAYGDGKFLVTWLDLRSDPTGNIAWVYGRSRPVRRRRHADVRRPRFPDRCRRRRRARQARRRRRLFHGQQAVPGRLPPVRRRRPAWQRHPRAAGVGHRAAGRRSDQHLVRQPLPGRGRRRLQPVERQVPRRLRNYYEPAGPATIQSRTVSAVERRARHGDRHRPCRATPTSPRSPTTPRTTSSCLAWWQSHRGAGGSTTGAS